MTILCVPMASHVGTPLVATWNMNVTLAARRAVSCHPLNLLLLAQAQTLVPPSYIPISTPPLTNYPRPGCRLRQQESQDRHRLHLANAQVQVHARVLHEPGPRVRRPGAHFRGGKRDDHVGQPGQLRQCVQLRNFQMPGRATFVWGPEV